jgi:hypothetical protein
MFWIAFQLVELIFTVFAGFLKVMLKERTY